MICIAFSLQFAYLSICLRAILKLQAYRMCCECLQAFLHFHTLSLSISVSSKACCLVDVCRHSFMFKPFPLSLNASSTVQFLSNFCSHSCTFTSVPSQSACQCLQAFLHFQTLSLSIGTSFTAPVWANVCSHSFTSTPLSSQSACQCLQAFLHFQTCLPLNQYVNICRLSFHFRTLSLSISMSSKASYLVNVCRHSFVLKPLPLSISTPFTVHFLANVCSHSFRLGSSLRPGSRVLISCISFLCPVHLSWLPRGPMAFEKM